MKIKKILFPLLGLILLLSYFFYKSDLFDYTGNKDDLYKDDQYAVFNDEGQLLRPENYRSWVFAGSVTTPKSFDENVLFPDFQVIYIDPVSYKYWKKNGEFRDGTILVKEILNQSDVTTSPVGKGFFMGDYRSLSATVKDSKRYPNTHGSWNYFNWTDRSSRTLKDTAAPLGERCALCHINNAPEGGPFYNYFSVLRDSKGVGDTPPENMNTRKGL